MSYDLGDYRDYLGYAGGGLLYSGLYRCFARATEEVQKQETLKWFGGLLSPPAVGPRHATSYPARGGQPSGTED